MKKIIAALSIIAVSGFATLALAWDQKPSLPLDACKDEMPLGIPKLAKPGHTLICRTGYALQHDPEAKIPAWVS